ncbi:MAG: DNA alkylation repair protein [Prevotella sp.]|nr:DNA alkylation repair protein [Prevotella sp.]
MSPETQEKLKQIKQSFRLLMNGAASKSMRDKGLQYKLNWGVQLADLKQMADTYGKDYELAIALWKENIRECKILATMMMPAEKMLPEIADLWMEQTDSIEIAEMAAFHLYQYLPYAPAMAFQWIASDRPLYQVCGYHILTRLFMDGRQPDERGISELMDQALAALTGDDAAVSHAAQLCLLRFADLGEPYETIARKAVKSVNLEFL